MRRLPGTLQSSPATTISRSEPSSSVTRNVPTSRWVATIARATFSWSRGEYAELVTNPAGRPAACNGSGAMFGSMRPPPMKIRSSRRAGVLPRRSARAARARYSAGLSRSQYASSPASKGVVIERHVGAVRDQPALDAFDEVWRPRDGVRTAFRRPECDPTASLRATRPGDRFRNRPACSSPNVQRPRECRRARSHGTGRTAVTASTGRKPPRPRRPQAVPATRAATRPARAPRRRTPLPAARPFAHSSTSESAIDTQKWSSARRRISGSLTMPPCSSTSGRYLHCPITHRAMFPRRHQLHQRERVAAPGSRPAAPPRSPRAARAP